MSKSLSVYLDLLRLLASVGVLLGHSYAHFMPQLGWKLGGHATASVAVFFVLSGFVIRFVTKTKERTGLDYILARATRLYSVVLVALAATLVLDYIGTSIAPEHYVGKSYYRPVDGIGAIAACLTFTNELWFSHVVVGSGEPYWSLGFEVSYYAIFGLAVFLRGRQRAVAVAVCALILGPKILLYLPLWLFGVVTYDFVASGRAARLGPYVGFALFVLPVIAYRYFLTATNGGYMNAFRSVSAVEMLRSAAWFSCVGVFAVSNIIGFAALFGARDIWPRGLTRAIRWSAGASFTLYLVHQPVILCGLALFPRAKASTIDGLAFLAIVIITVIFLAELGERRKRAFRTLVERCANLFTKPRLVAPDLAKS